MTEREAIHRLRASLLRCYSLIEEVVDNNPMSQVSREMATLDGVREVLMDTNKFKPTLDELKQLESNKPWMKNETDRHQRPETETKDS